MDKPLSGLVVAVYKSLEYPSDYAMATKNPTVINFSAQEARILAQGILAIADAATREQNDAAVSLTIYASVPFNSLVPEKCVIVTKSTKGEGNA
jgi:hypothetical protein